MPFETRSPRTSPFRKPPRRQAGQALRERLAVERDGYLFYLTGILVAALFMVGATWASWFLNPALTPWAATVVAVLISVVAGVDLAQRVRRGKRDRLGLRGELETAEWLAELHTMGYRVFHDLQSERGNIDHVAVGPGGVFVVETKARSKRPGDRVRYDGKQLVVGDTDVTEQCFGQIRACREEVRRQLRDYSDLLMHIPVRGILVFPEWDVEECSGAEIWVLNPKRRVAAWVQQEERAVTVTPETLAVAIGKMDDWARR